MVLSIELRYKAKLDIRKKSVLVLVLKDGILASHAGKAQVKQI